MGGDVSYRFTGRERATIELDGTFLPGRLAVPRQLALELDAEGRARLRLFAFHVDDLRIARVPLVRASYAEVVWRIAVRAGETAAWWVPACDLGARAPRLLASRYIHYPTRAGTIEVELDHVRVAGEAGSLAIALGPAGSEDVTQESRTLLVGPAAEWEVPWGDDGPAAHPAVAAVSADSLAEATVGGPVSWAGVAFVRQGREHRCGVARLR
jgi:hypothetical protein